MKRFLRDHIEWVVGLLIAGLVFGAKAISAREVALGLDPVKADVAKVKSDVAVLQEKVEDHERDQAKMARQIEWLYERAGGPTVPPGQRLADPVDALRLLVEREDRNP